MKFKSLLLAVGFIPAMVMAQGAPKIEAPVVVGTPSAGKPSSNGGAVAKPAAAPVAVKPAQAQPKPAEKAGQKKDFTYTPTATKRH
jgi:hypothetical protein